MENSSSRRTHSSPQRMWSREGTAYRLLRRSRGPGLGFTAAHQSCLGNSRYFRFSDLLFTPILPSLGAFKSSPYRSQHTATKAPFPTCSQGSRHTAVIWPWATAENAISSAGRSLGAAWLGSQDSGCGGFSHWFQILQKTNHRNNSHLLWFLFMVSKLQSLMLSFQLLVCAASPKWRWEQLVEMLQAINCYVFS